MLAGTAAAIAILLIFTVPGMAIGFSVAQPGVDAGAIGMAADNPRPPRAGR